MSRRKSSSKEKSPWNGVLLLDKPSGCTSHDVVQKVRRALGVRSVGHAGTLDPMASGLLILLLGEGTKLSDYLLTGDKGYWCEVKLGVQTDTLDRDGEIVAEHPVDVSAERIEQVVKECEGEMELPVPLYSAVKKEGRKLYEYARKNDDVEPPKRLMKFSRVSFEMLGADRFRSHFFCKKGNYVRSWAAHVGEQLGTGAIVDDLERTYSAPFLLKNAAQLEEFFSAVEQSTAPQDWKEALGPALLSLGEALPHWKAVMVAGQDEKLLLNGQVPKSVVRRLIPEQKTATRDQIPVGIKVLSGGSGNLLSLLEAQPQGGLKIRRVFRL